ncbi:Hypothetical predicted protein [Mytilus galloprovincialis]|uniref:C2H2-type domain-containing protein n=1 Tax=Mytilus galloprovincialis TaxID=29158 RepID=A0A8B6EEH4_MYTGA|nr:Hypothetical predicted protein [Mytilus galloprovincialis]
MKKHWFGQLTHQNHFTIEKGNQMKRFNNGERKRYINVTYVMQKFTKFNLSRHMNTHTRKRYECCKCSKTLSCLENLKRHEKICIRASKSHKKQGQFPCRHCGLPFDTYEDLFDHINVEHPLNQTGGQAGQVMDQMHSITDSSPPLLSDPSISTLNPQIENINPLPSEKKRRNRRVKKSALNDSVNQIEIIPEGNEKYDLLQFFSNVKGDI